MPTALRRTLLVTAFGVGGVFWLLMAAGSLLIAWNSLGYITEGTEHPFVLEKRPHSEGWFYLVMLWAHIASGAVVLLAALLQFFRPIVRRWPRFHTALGRAYVWAMLAVCAPTGFYLALFAKGGWGNAFGFILLGVVSVWFTWAGWGAARRRRVTAHRDWMIRSYAMATSSVSFRALHLVFFHLGLPYAQNYELSLWLGLLLNALAAELLIAAFSLSPRKTPQPQPERNPTHAVLTA
ncbi:MAG: DUF2306 domain-containing protein [Verrucomicrobiota bacterium]